MNRAESGRFGEQYICGRLAGEGCEILARNYRARCGEIDIIASDGKYIRFVEVKLRADGSMVSGLEAVTPAKMRRIVRTALLWLGEHPAPLQPRFDVAEVVVRAVGSDEVIHCNYIENAFDAEVCGEIF